MTCTSHHVRISTQDIIDGLDTMRIGNPFQRCVECGETVMITFGEGKGRRGSAGLDVERLLTGLERWRPANPRYPEGPRAEDDL